MDVTAIMARTDQTSPSGTPVVDEMGIPITPSIIGTRDMLDNDFNQKDRHHHGIPNLWRRIAAGYLGIRLNAFARSMFLS
jgi:hypothetical protein